MTLRTSPSRYAPVIRGCGPPWAPAGARAVSPMVCGPPLPQVQARRRRGRARQPRVVDTALRGVATACHQSAVVGPGKGFTDAAAYAGGNGLDTAVLPKRTAEAGVRCPEAAGQVSEP